MKWSQKSILSFIRFSLQIPPEAVCFHQTLTFPRIEREPAKAKHTLKGFLNRIHKRYRKMCSFYVMEQQKNQGIHFHLIFIFAPTEKATTSGRFESELRKCSFEAWKRYAGEEIVPQANKLNKLVKLDCEYFLKKIEVSQCNECSINPWGKRRAQCLRQFAVKVSGKEVESEFEKRFISYHIKEARKAVEGSCRYSLGSLRVFRLCQKWMGDLVDDSAWEGFKSRVVAEMDGIGANVSDKRFVRLLNSAKWKRFQCFAPDGSGSRNGLLYPAFRPKGDELEI